MPTHLTLYFKNALIIITTEGTLFVAEYNVDGVSLPSRIIRRNLRTGQTTDLFSTGDSIYNIALLDNNLLFLEFHNGIKAVSRYATGPVSAAQEVSTTGLESCGAFMGLHVAEGKCKAKKQNKTKQNKTKRKKKKIKQKKKKKKKSMFPSMLVRTHCIFILTTKSARSFLKNFCAFTNH